MKFTKKCIQTWNNQEVLSNWFIFLFLSIFTRKRHCIRKKILNQVCDGITHFKVEKSKVITKCQSMSLWLRLSEYDTNFVGDLSKKLMKRIYENFTFSYSVIKYAAEYFFGLNRPTGDSAMLHFHYFGNSYIWITNPWILIKLRI